MGNENQLEPVPSKETKMTDETTPYRFFTPELLEQLKDAPGTTLAAFGANEDVATMFAHFTCVAAEHGEAYYKYLHAHPGDALAALQLVHEPSMQVLRDNSRLGLPQRWYVSMQVAKSARVSLGRDPESAWSEEHAEWVKEKIEEYVAICVERALRAKEELK